MSPSNLFGFTGPNDIVGIEVTHGTATIERVSR